MRASLVVVSVVAVAAGCTKPAPAPDLVKRDAVAADSTTTRVGARNDEPVFVDGGVPADAGLCCVVRFALRQEVDEVGARVVLGSQLFPMGADGGVWWVDACAPLRSDVYLYEVAFPTDDDAGVLWFERVNEGAPTSSVSSVAPVVNVFDSGDAGSCQALDARVHASLPDAG